MFYYEEMNSDILFVTGFDSYMCKCWNGVAFRRVGNKDLLVLTTNCYDEGLHDFINTYGEFNIEFDTSTKNCDGEDKGVLFNRFYNMKLLLQQTSFKTDFVTDHIFIFGDKTCNEQDAIDMLNYELKEEIIKEVLNRINSFPKPRMRI